MATKKSKTTHGQSYKAGQKKRKEAPSVPNTNIHDIEFKDNAQRERYEDLFKRKIIPTRYVDINTIQALGIEQNVNELFHNIGWDTFMSMKCNTYERVTLEFLSSLDYRPIEHKLIFRLFDVDHELSMEHFCLAYGFGNTGVMAVPKYTYNAKPGAFAEKEFWGQIGSDTYVPASSKATRVYNPVFRYVHKVMSNTIFGRGESTDVVGLNELFFLWAMVNKKPVHSGHFLAQRLYKVARGKAGDIVIGGLITILANYLDYGGTIEQLEAVPGNMKIDIDVCEHMQMIKAIGKGFRLLVNGKDSILLPVLKSTNDVAKLTDDDMDKIAGMNCKPEVDKNEDENGNENAAGGE